MQPHRLAQLLLLQPSRRPRPNQHPLPKIPIQQPRPKRRDPDARVRIRQSGADGEQGRNERGHVHAERGLRGFGVRGRDVRGGFRGDDVGGLRAFVHEARGSV